MSQFKIIAGDKKEYGPVSVEEVGRWIQQGRANGDTRVQAEGETDWTPLREVPELAVLLGGPTPQPGQPQAHGPGGVAPQMDPPLPADLETRDHGVWSAGCFGRGWELFSANMGGMIGISAILVGVIVVVVILSIIPFIGILFSLAWMVLNPVLIGGFWYYFIRASRGQRPTVGELFSGFSRNFRGLFLVNLIQGLIILATCIPGLVLVIIGFVLPFIEAAKAGVALEFTSTNILMILGGYALMLPTAIYLGTCWFFAIPLAIDRRLGFWEAMQTSRKVVNKHWFQIFFFVMVVGIIAELGVLLCGVGLLFTVPLGTCMAVSAYEHLFGERTQLPAGAAQSPAQP